MSTDGALPPASGETRIDWGRAVFAGATIAGVMWAIVVGVTSMLDDGWPVALRLTFAVAVAFLPVALVGLGLRRWARGPGGVTWAVTAFVAAGVGVLALPLAMLASGALQVVIGR